MAVALVICWVRCLWYGCKCKGQSIKIGVADVQKVLETNDFSILHIDANWGLFWCCVCFWEHGLPSIILLRIQKFHCLSTITGRNSFDLARYFFGFLDGLNLWSLNSSFYINKPEVYHWQFDVRFSSSAFNRYNTGTDASSYGRGLFRAIFCKVRLPLPGKSFSLALSTLFFFLWFILWILKLKNMAFWTMQIYYLGAGLFSHYWHWTTDWNCLWVFMRLPMYLALSFKIRRQCFANQNPGGTKLENPWPMILSFYLWLLLCGGFVQINIYQFIWTHWSKKKKMNHFPPEWIKQ